MRSLFFFNDTATTEIYTLSLHDALPISIDPLKRSLWPARYSQPSSVGTYVISLTHTLFGSATANRSPRIFSATGRVCRESVVALNFLFCLQRIPSLLRIRLIRRTRTRTLCSARSSCSVSAPQTCRFRRCAALISTSSRPSLYALIQFPSVDGGSDNRRAASGNSSFPPLTSLPPSP